MAGNLLEALTIGGDSVQDLTGLAAHNIPLPNLDLGSGAPATEPRFVLVHNQPVTVGVGTTIYVRPAVGGIPVATEVNGMPIAPDRHLILNVAGCDGISSIGDGGSGSRVHITPLANQ